MKWKLMVGGIVVVVLAIAAAIYFSFTSYAAIGNLNIYSGAADIIRGNSKVSGTTGAAVSLGDEISVATGSRVAIILKDGTVVRLEGGSDARVADLSYKGGKIEDAVFALTIGRMWAHVAPISTGGSFAVETPTSVATVRGTAFSLTYLNGQTELFVASRIVGFALASDPTNEKEVSPGELFVVRDASLTSDFLNGPVMAPASYFDNWINFNEEEDLKLGEAGEAQSPAASSTASSTAPSASLPTNTKRPPTPPQTNQPSSTSPGTTVAPTKTVVSIVLTAAAVTVTQNSPLHLRAVAAYSDQSTADITGSATWSQSPSLGLIDNLGNFHGFNTGQTTITASFGGATSNGLQVTVTAAKTLSRLAVSYQKSQQGQFVTGRSAISAQFSATAYWSDGTTQDVTTSTTWSVTPGGSAKGSITAAGLYTAGSSEGQDAIIAQYGGLSVSTPIQVP